MTFFSLIFSIFLSIAGTSGHAAPASSHVHSAPAQPSPGSRPAGGGGIPYTCVDNGGMPLC